MGIRSVATFKQFMLTCTDEMIVRSGIRFRIIWGWGRGWVHGRDALSHRVAHSWSRLMRRGGQDALATAA